MGMTREIALHCMKSASELERELCEECPIYGQTGSDHCFEDALQYVIGMLEQEPTTKNDLEVDLTVAYIQGKYDAIRESKIGNNSNANEVLDKIRKQIKSNLRGVEITLDVLVENDPLRPKMEGAKDTLEDCLELIDKYKAESEPQESGVEDGSN